MSLACRLVSGGTPQVPPGLPERPTEPPPAIPTGKTSSVDLPQPAATIEKGQPTKPPLPTATEEPPNNSAGEFEADPSPDGGLCVISGDENKLTTYFEDGMMF
jgi:hypothetical protein